MTVQKHDPKNEIYVNLTQAAIEHIKKQIKAEGKEVLRLATSKTGCSGFSYLAELIKAPKTSDIELANDYGLKIFMASDSIELLNKMTIDFELGELGQKKLIYINPNETARCGCGESFTAKKV